MEINKEIIFISCGLLLFLLKSQAQTVTDIDGNIYNTIEIGNQKWMQENLKTTRFNNGVEIETTTGDTNTDYSSIYQWAYDDDETNVDDYGRLYSWVALVQDDNVCPVGWHVPSEAEWLSLREHLGGEFEAGGKMKETGTEHWLTTNENTDNSSGFTGLGGGFRANPSGYLHQENLGFFWSSTMLGGNEFFPRGVVFQLHAENNFLTSGLAVGNCGGSVRCLEDLSTNLIDEAIENKLQIYPNPTSDQIKIEFEVKRDYQMFVYDMKGVLVLEGKLSEYSNLVNLETLAKGAYLLKIVGEDYQYQETLIKE